VHSSRPGATFRCDSRGEMVNTSIDGMEPNSRRVQNRASTPYGVSQNIDRCGL
jgi:hypothetical protein